MKYGKIAKMGSAKDKQDKYSTEFSKGESVVVNLPDGTNYTGAVVKDKGMMVVVDVAGTRYEFKSIFVKAVA